MHSLSDLAVRDARGAVLSFYGLLLRGAGLTALTAVSGYGYLSFFHMLPSGGFMAPFSDMVVAGGVMAPAWLAILVASVAAGALPYLMMIAGIGWGMSTGWSTAIALLVGVIALPFLFGAMVTVFSYVGAFATTPWALAAVAVLACGMALGAYSVRQLQRERRVTNVWAVQYVKRFRLIAPTVSIGLGLAAWLGPTDWKQAIVSVPVLAVILLAQVGLVLLFPAAGRSIREYGHSVSPAGAIFLLGGVPAMVWFSFQAGQTAPENRVIDPQLGVAALLVVLALGLAVAWRSLKRRDSYRSKSKVGENASQRLLRMRPRSFQVLTAVRRFSSRLIADVMPVWRGLAFAARLVGEMVRVPVSFVDYVLAKPLALVFGAALNGRVIRYAALCLHIAAAMAAIAWLPGWWAAAGFIWASLAVLSLARRGNWIEADREYFLIAKDERPSAQAGVRIGFEQDLLDEVVFAFLVFFGVVLPATIWSADTRLGLFVHGDKAETEFVDWLILVGGELVKALPFIDWSEIYDYETTRMLTPRDDRGLHVIFALRAAMDVLLVTTLLQGLAISQRVRRRRRQLEDPRDPTSTHDVFEERDLMRRSVQDWRVVHALRFYEDERLVLLLQNSEDPIVLRGAARVAGYGLAPKSLRLILRPAPTYQFAGRRERALRLHVMLPQVREAAIEGLQRRVALMERAISYPNILGAKRRRDKEYTADLRTRYEAELLHMERVRQTALEITQAALASPAQREEASEALKRREREDLEIILRLVSSKDEESATTAIRGLSLITRGSEHHDWIATELMKLGKDRNLPVVRRQELMSAAGRIEHKGSHAYLAEMFKDGSEDLGVRIAAVHAATNQKTADRDVLQQQLRAVMREHGAIDRVVGNRLTTAIMTALPRLMQVQED